MNSRSDKAVAGGSVDGIPTAATARHTGAPMIMLWGTVAVSLTLLVAAGAVRIQSSRPVPVHWGALPSSTEVAVPQVRSSGGRSDESSGILLPVTSDLVGVGAQLDAPGFGELGNAGPIKRDESLAIDRRWQFGFSPGLTEGQYAQQLAVLGVELGVLAADGSLQYVAGIGDTGAKRRNGTRRKDKRPYWTWERGDMRRADQVLLGYAGLPVTDEIVLHFLSPEAIETLEKLEKEFQDREPEDILLTRFSLKRTFRGYELFVVEQIER